MLMPYYYLLTFSSTDDAIGAEKYLKSKIPVAFMPVPQDIINGCGLAIRFIDTDDGRIMACCEGIPVACTLFRMCTSKKNGTREFTKLHT